MKAFLNIIYWSLIGFALIQFIPVNRENKPVDTNVNFVDVMKTPPKITALLKSSCYDCHSDETVYPDYAYVAPISWSVKKHVNDGREHLNFSEWTTFNQDLKKNMLESSAADLKQNRMPLPGYMAQHPESRLTVAEKKLLVDYFESVLKNGNY